MLRRLLLLWMVMLIPCWGAVVAQQKVASRKLDSLQALADAADSDSLWLERQMEVCGELRKADLPASFPCYEGALQAARRRGYARGEAYIGLRIGYCYELTGDYMAEMRHYQKALETFLSMGDSTGIADAYNSFGNLYNSLTDYDIALDYHRKSLRIRQSLGNPKELAASFNNIGNVYVAREEYEEALRYYHEAETLNLSQHNEAYLSNNYTNIGNILEMQGHPEEAIRYHEMAMELRKNSGNALSIASCKLFMGFAYNHMKEHDKAIALIEEAMEIVRENQATALLERGYFGLYSAYKGKGDYGQALDYHEKFLAITDSLRSEQVSGEVARAQIQMQTQQELRERELRAQNVALKAEAARERERNVYLLALFGVGLLLALAMVLALFLWLRNRAQKRSELILEARVEERTLALQQANDELRTFIYQSSHDMRSPLTSIKGLASLAMEAASPEEQQHFLALIVDRAGHLDNVYTSLIEFMNVKERQPKSERIDLAQMETQLREALAQKRGAHPLTLVWEVPQGFAPQADGFLLQAILQALALNAIDFRDATRANACLVRFRTTAAGWELQVQDNGIGMEAAFLPSATEMFVRGSLQSCGSGLGLYTAEIAAQKMGGRLRIESQPGQGTTVTVTVPGLQ